VIVAGLHMRGADWEFRAHVLNRHNGTESIEVVGGRPGDRKIRSFGPDRIFAAMGAKGSRGNPERAKHLACPSADRAGVAPVAVE
jgi:hypothetical protein